VNESWLAVVNPAAGGGRCRKLVGPALERLRAAGLSIEVAETAAAGDATRLARDFYGRGYRRFLAVGGDGTSYEIVNGLFPEAAADCPRLGFLPLGTGNSFLRDFSTRGLNHATEALLAGRWRKCDVIRLRHSAGILHFINLLSLGFAADVAMLRHRRFQGYGELGYVLATLVTLLRLKRRPFPLRVDDETIHDERRCLFLSFNNSKFTGGKMMIAPQAETADGRIEYVRWGPVGRVGLIANLPGLYTGAHIRHRLAERRSAREVHFALEGPVDVMVDGEVLTVHCQSLDVLPGALEVVV
jgi:YegS/Rv2252/BmrU family lipid kinase